MSRPWLVTGAAGFIGFHLSRRLVEAGRQVIAVDNLEETYEPALKRARLERLVDLDGVRWRRADITDERMVGAVIGESDPEVVIHLAARAGVRGSHLDPLGYVHANVVGFANVLEHARRAGCAHVVYASSSSVYGLTSDLPFTVEQPADHPISVYAATKRADELLAHSYSHSYGLPTTGLRFFTVYGPLGRPDMAYFAFADAILAGRAVRVFGDGSARRDFTYVDDVVDSVVELAARPPSGVGHPAAGGGDAPWRLYNVGHGARASVNELIDALELRLGRPAVRVHEPRHLGDVRETRADTTPLREVTGAAPATPLDVGLDRFVSWLREYREGVGVPPSSTPARR